MSTLKENIENFAKQTAEKMGAYLFGIEVKNISSRQPVIVVKVDTEAGITIGECGTFSRELGDLIDAYDLFKENYRLDVSSPGMSIAIQYDWQLKRAVGKHVHVCFKSDDKKDSQGILESFDDSAYHLKVGKKNEITDISRDDVEEIKVVPQW